jgi:tRNA threonylcarbamoyladenosine biosynthesis protein TsaB
MEIPFLNRGNGWGLGCVMLMVMPEGEGTPQSARDGETLLLGIDTCGPAGSVALGRVGTEVQILGETELEGRSYSATLITAIGELLTRFGLRVADVGAIVAVSGPGSFTGVRVGLSAAKGLAEAAGIPIVAVSRLEALCAKAGADSAAIDAHRKEVFLRVELAGSAAIEILAGVAELAALEERPARIAVCDDAAEYMLQTVWPAVPIVRATAPTAADAVNLAAPRVKAGEYIDPLVLDGHYLRRSDAEIFGDLSANEPAPSTRRGVGPAGAAE